MKELIINRRLWQRGLDSNHYLVNEETGKYCCLGIFGVKNGVKKHEMTSAMMPSSVACRADKRKAKIASIFAPLLSYKLRDNITCEKLSAVNDSCSSYYKNEKRREKRIAKLFSKIGVKVKFTN